MLEGERNMKKIKRQILLFTNCFPRNERDTKMIDDCGVYFKIRAIVTI
jgi:hypothetical protein